MFAFGFIRGTILGISLGFMSALIVKKICKKKNKVNESNTDKKAT